MTPPTEVLQAATAGAPELAQYILIRELGQGGSGTVYAAWDKRLGRWAAVKVLNQITAENAARFLREAQMASRLSHPHIVPLYEASETEAGRPFLAMKLIHGQQLSKVQLEVKRACAVMRDVGDAVQYAHDNGVIHRDLKPQNLMLDEAGHVWILDFGLAHSIDNGSTLTVAGAIVGTPAFMPPEQARGTHCDERSDVYALGATLYALLSGRAPFEGDNALWVMTQVLADDPPALRSLNERVPKDIETIVQKAMRREAPHRYGRARDFADDLRRHERGEVVSARPVGAAARFAKSVRRNKVAAVTLTAVVLGAAIFGLGALRYAADMKVREQATAEARALAEARLAQATQHLKTAERNRAESVVEEGNALGAAGTWQAAGLRYQAADTIFKGLGEEDPGPNAGMTDVLMRTPPPVWSDPAFHGARITELLLNGDDTRAYSASLDRTVKIFNPRNHQVEHTFELQTPVWALALHPSEQYLAAATENGQAVVWSTQTHVQVLSLQEESSRLRAIGFSQDGRILAGGYINGKVVTWTFPEGRRLAMWKEPEADVRSVVFPSMTGGALAVGLAYERTGPWAVLRNAYTGERLQVWSSEKALSGIRNLVADPRTGTLYAGFAAGLLILPKGQRTAETYPSFGAVVSASLAAPGDRVAMGFLNGALQVRSASQPDRILFALQEGAGEVTRLGRDGRLMTATEDGALKLWSVGMQPLMGRIEGQAGGIGVQMAMGGNVAIVEHKDGIFVALDRTTGKTLWKLKLPVPAHSFSLPSTRADRLATCDQEGHLRIFELPTGRQLTSIHNSKPVRFLRFSPDSQCLGATFNNRAALFNATTGDLIKAFDHEDTHRLVAFSPDGRRVAMMHGPNLVVLDIATARVTQTFPHKPGWRATDGFWEASSGTVIVGFLEKGIVAHELATGHQRPLLVSEHVANQVAKASASTDLMWFGAGKQQNGRMNLELWDLTKPRRVHAFDSGATRVAEPHLPLDVPLAVSLTPAGEVVTWDLTLPGRFATRQDEFDLAVGNPEQLASPRARLAMARYFSLRGLNDWAADEFSHFANAPGPLRDEVTALEYARAMWLGGRLDEALVHYQRALAKGEAPADYVRLCIDAVKRERDAPPGGVEP